MATAATVQDSHDPVTVLFAETRAAETCPTPESVAAEQSAEHFQTLLQRRFLTMPGRLEITGLGELIGQIGLGSHSMRGVVAIEVALPMAQAFGPGIVRVPKVQRHLANPTGADIGHGPV